MKKVFENGETTLFHFMQCMENILRYIDNFTHSNNIILLDADSQKLDKSQIPITGSHFAASHETLTKIDAPPPLHPQEFRITRTNSTTKEEKIITITVTLKLKRGSKIVEYCTLNFNDNDNKKKVNNRANLRDMICSYWVPVLRIFPILNIILENQKQKRRKVSMTAILNDCGAVSSSLSPLCMQMIVKHDDNHYASNEKVALFIALDSDDRVVTWNQESAIASFKTWDLESVDDLKKGHFPKNMLLFLSFVIGTVNQAEII